MSVFQNLVSNPMIGKSYLVTWCMTDELSVINKLESIHGAPQEASEAPPTANLSYSLVIKHGNGKSPQRFDNVPI